MLQFYFFPVRNNFQFWRKVKKAQFGQIKKILKNTTFWIHKLSIENKYGVERKEIFVHA